MNKTAIKNFAVWARQKLIEDITYKAGLLGVSDKGIAEALPQSTSDLKFFDIGTKDYAEVSGKEIKQRDALVSAIKAKERDTKDYKEAFEFIIEEVAYTWFNRLIAIRFMEVNDYLPSGIRVLSSENPAKNEPDFVTNPFEADLDLTPFEQDKVVELKDQNKSDELFRMLFIKQCNKLHEVLPRLFEKTDDYSELLLSISFTDNDGIIYHLTHDISEDDFNVEKEGQIEIIGWMYQYYNIEPKAAVFARAKGKKIKKEQVPAATQLFTPDWIVRYMVENSLGRLWYEGHSDSNIKDNWKYYLDEAEQEAEVQEKLNAIKEEYKSIKPEDIKLIDPCMGSGHILVYAFDVLMQIYENYGYTQRDAASLIIENNIYGLDIDERAAQLAYFAVMMKGRQYDRRFLTRGMKPHVYDVPDIEAVDKSTVDAFGDCADIARRVCDSFIDGKEYGSLIEPKVSLDEIDKLNKKIGKMQSEAGDIFSQTALNIVEPLKDVVRILVQKYHISVTNPPYMGNASLKLSVFLQDNFSDEKYDTYAAFVEKCNSFVKINYFSALVTGESWMFLPSFKNMREKIIRTRDTISMAHLGMGAFEAGFGTTAVVFRRGFLGGYKSNFIRLADERLNIDKNKALVEIDKNKTKLFVRNQSDFSVVEGSPYIYWMNQKVLETFNKSNLGKYAVTKAGIVTGNNDFFMKFWYEILHEDISFRTQMGVKNLPKYVPAHKGGGNCKYYGNIDYVMKINDLWNPALAKSNMRRGDREYYFLEGLTWSTLSNRLAFRYSPVGFVYETKGSMCFVNKGENIYYVLGLLNSSLCNYIMNILSPTLDFNRSSLLKMPFVHSSIYENEVVNLTRQNVSLSKSDWDAFETSWDFDEHPLVKWSKSLWDCTAIGATMCHYYGDTRPEKVSGSLEFCYLLWQGECNERFNELKRNEEELNRIFIDIYGLIDELTPDVEDKDVTVRKADLQRDIKSLISYVVGCMFGRYSLDVDGLAYAGGEWDDRKYDTFIPDEDNCIPVTDEEYFEDDIVGRFCDFIKIVFGEDSLEANLKYIANALGNKGTTSRDVIRNYFLKDFIKDHIKTYQKRPIYWMFDSGKQNGFKALVYMHRWNADTIGNMRVEYLHRMQRVYDKEIERMQEIIDNSNDNKEINVATKRKEKLQKQLKETKDYDAKIAHLALSCIDIDLDDGVKVNYEKVQTPPDGKKMQVLAKI